MNLKGFSCWLRSLMVSSARAAAPPAPAGGVAHHPDLRELQREHVVATLRQHAHTPDERALAVSAEHLAARMEQLASPGSILLAPPTLRLVEGLIAVKPLGPVPVKGLAEPVEVCEVIGVGPAGPVSRQRPATSHAVRRPRPRTRAAPQCATTRRQRARPGGRDRR
jgi:hypothetical protein